MASAVVRVRFRANPHLRRHITSDTTEELKLDGYRALAIKNKTAVRLLSRRNNTLNEMFPVIAEALKSLDDGLILDGEVVALNAKGRPSFNLLQHHKANASTIVYYVFDVVAFRGRDVQQLPLRQRRGLLEDAFQNADEPLRLSAALAAAPEDLIAAVKAQGLEGIIANASIAGTNRQSEAAPKPSFA